MPPDEAQRQENEDWGQAEAAREAKELEGEEITVAVNHQPTEQTVTPPAIEEPKPPKLTQYYGAVTSEHKRINWEIGVIVDEVIQRLTSLTGCNVEIRVKFSARRTEGFDEVTVRTISENSRTLKFSNFEFD